MKYVLIIPDGAADFALDDLDGRTPFEAARKPQIDKLAMHGRQGTVATTPEGMPCGSDVCCMSLLGYNPKVYHSGRAPLEAAALGLDLVPTDWIFRINLVTVIDGAMQDHSAGHISSEEGRQLIEEFASRVDIPGMRLHPGVSYRNIMVDESGRSGNGRDWSPLSTTPPHDIPGEPIRKHLPRGGKHVDILQAIIAESQVFLADHEINQTRRDLGELPATHFWPWGQGQRPKMEPFDRKYGVRGAMITAVDLLAGLASFMGWQRLDAPGQTSYHDTDYPEAGRVAIDALDEYDLVCVHIEAPDEAGHAADPATKVAAIEAIDEHVVGPIHDALRRKYGEDWRLLYMPDHYTLCSTRKHHPEPVPFVLAGKRTSGVLQQTFSEANAAESDLHISHGHELMEYMLRGGLA